MILKIRKRFFSNFNVVDIIIILSILVSKSLYYETFGQNKLLIGFLLLIGIFALFKSYRKELIFTKKTILLYFLIIIAVFINPNAALSTSLVFLSDITIALLFITLIPFYHFTSVFYKLMKILMIFSLLKYPIILLHISSPFPDFISITGDHYQNFIFFGIFKGNTTYFQMLRNNGLWWEPGAFQIFINLAFLLGLLFKKVSNRDYFLFLIVIVTTFSTSGILIFSVLSFIYFKRKSNLKLLLIAIVISLPLITASSYYQIVVQQKISLNNPSARSRYYDAIVPLRMFASNPIIGIGLGNKSTLLKYTAKFSYGTGSNGMLLLLANLGLLSFFIFIPLVFPNYLKNLPLDERFLGSVCILLLFIPENFTIILIFSLLTFYGSKSLRTLRYEGLNY